MKQLSAIASRLVEEKRMQFIEPELWSKFQRLEDAGCPLDSHLLREHCPLAVGIEETLAGEGERIVPGDHQVNLAVPVRILARSANIVTGYQIEADWFRGTGRPMPPCPDHPGRYCLRHNYPSVTFSCDQVLNPLVAVSRKVVRGEYVSGVLLATFDSVMSRAEERKITIIVHDIFQNRFSFELKLISETWEDRLDRDFQAHWDRAGVTRLGGEVL